MFQTIDSPAARTAAAAISAETGLVRAGNTEPILCSSLNDILAMVDCQFSTCSWIQQTKINDTSAPKGASVERLIAAVSN